MKISPEKPSAALRSFGDVKGYETLASALTAAYDQAARGKGKERHSGDNKPFDTQPIFEIPRMVGVGGLTYQVMKKAQEATSMSGRHEYDAAKKEMLGAIVYAAAAYLFIEELAEKQEARDRRRAVPVIGEDMGIYEGDDYHGK